MQVAGHGPDVGCDDVSVETTTHINPLQEHIMLKAITTPVGQVAGRRKKGVPVYPCAIYQPTESGEIALAAVVARPTQPKRSGARRPVSL